MSDLGRRVQAALRVPEGPAAVALSGGADSAVCAWALQGAGVETRGLHVHHGLPASDRMAEAAAGVARRLGLGLVVLAVEPSPGASPEGRARAARYAALTAALRPGEWLATGHTRDDQAETVLLALLRGAGADGLAGIPALRPPVVRPLLGVPAGEARELATLLGLPWRDDPENHDLRHLRNRVRHRLLPLLEAEYAAGTGAALVRTAAVVGAEGGLLDELAASIPVERAGSRCRVAAGPLLAAAPVVAARAVRRAVERLRPPYSPGPGEVAVVLEVASRRRVAGELAGGVRVTRSGPYVLLSREEGVPGVPDAVGLTVPGSARFGRFRIDAVVGAAPPVRPLSLWALVTPVGSAAPALVVRPAAPGERIPVGGGTKPVAEMLAEAGVPLGERAGWPVVALDDGRLWIPAVRRPGSPAVAGNHYLSVSVVEESEWDASGP